MKIKITLLSLLLICFKVHSQNIDNGIIKCTYNFTFQKDSNNVLVFGKDVMVLEIGQNVSLFYSEPRRKGDSLLMADQKSGVTINSGVNTDKYNLYNWSIVLAKNFPSDKITGSETIIQPYKYTEELAPQKWTITNDTCTLLDMVCFRAKTNFRGRDYEAWFTKKIPTTHGPWKFYGLPGLIVKVSDSKKQFNFELTDIKKMPTNSFIFFPEKKYVKVSREVLGTLKQKMADDPIGFMENNTPYHIKFPYTPEERKARKEPYNPLELL
jgi:GLPGLI family protein